MRIKVTNERMPCYVLGVSCCENFVEGDICQIEKNFGKDIQAFIWKAIDAWYDIDSGTIFPGDVQTVQTEVYAEDELRYVSCVIRDCNGYKFTFYDIREADADAMISWLRREKKVFYAIHNANDYNSEHLWVTPTEAREIRRLNQLIEAQNRRIAGLEAGHKRKSEIIERKEQSIKELE